MWAWIVQRVAAIAVIPLILVHIAYPYTVATQFLLVMVVVFHGMLGVRVLLIDIGVNVKSEKVILALVAFIGFMLLVVMGRHLF
jgi:succinate dehydrogenase/fumarate reductase cytochrome b subunit